MPGPLLLLAIPLLAAVIISLALRRFPLAAALVAAGTALLLLLLLTAIPVAGETSWLPMSGTPFTLFGRSLALATAVRQTLRLLYGGAALLFLLAALTGDHPDFSSAGIAALSPLAFVLMAQPFLFGVVALFVSAGMIAVLIQGGRAGSTLASLRFLLMAALAAAALLVAGWMLESQQLVLASSAWRLLLLSIILLLGSFPFHIWLRPLVRESSPLAVTYVLGLLPLVLVAFIGPVLADRILLRQADAFAAALRWAAVATALVAAFLIATSRRPDALLAYLILGDSAAVLMALSLGQPGLSAALFALLLRLVSLLLCALGLHLMNTPAEDAGRRPWAVALFAYGAFSLAGFPLTPGFAGRWAILDQTGAVSVWFAASVLLVTVAGVAGLLRWLVTWFATNGHGATIQRSRLLRVLVVVLLLGAVLIALRPGALLDTATALAAHF